MERLGTRLFQIPIDIVEIVDIVHNPGMLAANTAMRQNLDSGAARAPSATRRTVPAMPTRHPA